jgi:peptide/nickel transport system permease protein
MYYLLIRCTQASVVFFGVSFLTFCLQALSPGEFFQQMRLNPQISENTVSRLRAEHETDQPVLLRYSHWVQRVAHGDLGYSFAYGTSVASLLRVRARNTLVLAGISMCTAWSLALVLGVYCAQFSSGWFDRVCFLGTSTALSIPELLLGLCALALASRTGWFPAGGMASPEFKDLTRWSQVWDLARHLCLPTVVLSVSSLPVLFRHVRSAVRDALASPFIRAAKAHGISRHRLLLRYALPAAANPIVSLFGLSVGSLLSASLLTEVIMSWPGLGPLLLEAVMARDTYIVIGATMVSTSFLLIGTAVADVLLCIRSTRAF